LFGRCDERLIYFNRRTAAILTIAPPHVVTGSTIEPGVHRVPKVTARVRVGEWTLVLDGIVHLL